MEALCALFGLLEIMKFAGEFMIVSSIHVVS